MEDTKPTFENYPPEVKEYLLSQYLERKGMCHVMKTKKACIIGTMLNYLILTTPDMEQMYMLGGKNVISFIK